MLLKGALAAVGDDYWQSGPQGSRQSFKPQSMPSQELSQSPCMHDKKGALHGPVTASSQQAQPAGSGGKTAQYWPTHSSNSMA